VAEIINLRQARKIRTRRKAEVAADANRAKFGRTKAEKARDAHAAATLDRTIDGARLRDVDDEEIS
jgi:hypothetical protein